MKGYYGKNFWLFFKTVLLDGAFVLMSVKLWVKVRVGPPERRFLWRKLMIALGASHDINRVCGFQV
jgi:hypothetical protein